MRTLFICATGRIDHHEGEFYDDIVEVSDSPTSETITDIAQEIRERIRELWVADQADSEREGEEAVAVYLDAASPFVTMLIDYQIVMEKEENVKVILPDIKTEQETSDTEALNLLGRLKEREERV
jgi:hypothetical protein